MRAAIIICFFSSWLVFPSKKTVLYIFIHCLKLYLYLYNIPMCNYPKRMNIFFKIILTFLWPMVKTCLQLSFLLARTTLFQSLFKADGLGIKKGKVIKKVLFCQ